MNATDSEARPALIGLDEDSRQMILDTIKDMRKRFLFVELIPQ